MANKKDSDVGGVSTDKKNESASKKKDDLTWYEKGLAWLGNALDDVNNSLDSVYDISVKYNNIKGVFSGDAQSSAPANSLDVSEKKFSDYLPYIGAGVGIAVLAKIL